MNRPLGPVAAACDIETARLRLRPFDEGDEALYCDLYTDEETMRFIGPPWPRERALRGFHKVLARHKRAPPACFYLTIIEKRTGQAQGLCGISRFDTGRARAEIGAVLKPATWGQRFAQEALTALVNAAFSLFPVDELWVQYPVAHRGAQTLVERMGFVATGSAGEGGNAGRTGSIYRKM